MKLVDFDTFCRMPAGTIFAPYEPCYLCDGLIIKVDAGETLPNGVHCFDGTMPLHPDIDDWSDLHDIGDEVEGEFITTDGSNVDYMQFNMFLILDEREIDELISVLQWAKNGCKGE